MSDYEFKLKAYALSVLRKIVGGDKSYTDSDLHDCTAVLFGGIQ
jgi:hypothetical protein